MNEQMFAPPDPPHKEGPFLPRLETRGHSGPAWVTLGEDACHVRLAGAPPVLAALNGAVLGLMDFLGISNVAKQMRYFDAHPSEMVSLLCRDLQR